MITINNDDKSLLQKVQHYNGYEVRLVVNENKIIFTDKDYESLYKVDIVITKDEKEYLFKDYYIKLYTDVRKISNDIIAEFLVENMHSITFDNSKFIGEIKKINGEATITNNSEISLLLMHAQYNKNDIKINNIYLEYLKAKEESDKNLILKYESFFEIYFSTHRIPDLIKKYFLEKKNMPDKIIDYSVTDELIKKELEGKTCEFHFIISEILKDELLIHTLCKLKDNMDVCERIFDKIEIFLNSKVKSDTINNSIDKLMAEYDSLSFFEKLKKKSQMKKTILKAGSNKFDEENEANSIKLFVQQLIRIEDNILQSFDNLTINEIKEKITTYYKKTSHEYQELSKKYNNISIINKDYSPQANSTMLKDYIESLSFDDLYDYLEDEDLMKESKAKCF